MTVKNIYSVPVGLWNQQTSVEESKYEEKNKSELIFLVNLSQRRNQARYQKIKQCAYTLFLVHLPYYINKATRIHVFYCTWHHHCIIWVMDMRQNISSGVGKNVLEIQNKDWMHFCRDILMGNHKKKRKETKLSYWGMAYIHAIWYI